MSNTTFIIGVINMLTSKKQYSYNPHNHVKIWLSNKPSVFMNIENQMRLISMREKNPTDQITLIYDSSLLNATAITNLNRFCNEHRITPVDADTFAPLLSSDNERTLYNFYKDEITHLKDGGNLAVASDIIRWLPPVYSRGTYTDFDVPVDTTQLPPTINIEAPLLLNIGSLQTRGKEVILTNNDYIAVIDPIAAKNEIEQVQNGFIKVLSSYTNDFIEKTEEEFGGDSFLNRYFIDFMRNRSESIYIARSKSNFQDGIPRTSRILRQHINEIMTVQSKFLEFNKLEPNETNESIVKRLRVALNNQLGLMKWLFFRNEYNEIKKVLEQSDDVLVNYLMKKERSLYLKSVVICTTGPIAIAKFLFKGYVFNPKHFSEFIQPFSFNHYNLKKAFQSQNSIPIHENILGMMNFLGAEDGALNDSSWLEEGAKLQQNRGQLLEDKIKTLKKDLPSILLKNKNDIENHIEQIKANCEGFFGFFHLDRKKAKIKALGEVLTCFQKDTFDTSELRKVLENINSNSDKVYAGLLSSKTQTLVEELNQYCNEAIVFGLTQNRQIQLNKGTQTSTKLDTPTEVPAVLSDVFQGKGLGFFTTNTTTKVPSSVSDEPKVSL